MKDSDHWVVGVCPDDPLALVQGRLYPEITANCVIAWREIFLIRRQKSMPMMKSF